MPVIKSKMIRVRDPETGFWHDLPATVSEESFRAAERALESETAAASSAASAASSAGAASSSASDAATSAGAAASSASDAAAAKTATSGYADTAGKTVLPLEWENGGREGVGRAELRGRRAGRGGGSGILQGHGGREGCGCGFVGGKRGGVGFRGVVFGARGGGICGVRGVGRVGRGGVRSGDERRDAGRIHRSRISQQRGVLRGSGKLC